MNLAMRPTRCDSGTDGTVRMGKDVRAVMQDHDAPRIPEADEASGILSFFRRSFHGKCQVHFSVSRHLRGPVPAGPVA